MVWRGYREAYSLLCRYAAILWVMRFAEVSPIYAVRSIRHSVEVMGDALFRSVAYNVQNVFKVLMLFKSISRFWN